MRRSTLPLLVGLTLLVGPSPAQAHGRFPESDAVVFDPGDPDHLLIGTTFGPVTTADGGTTWRWFCRSLVGASLAEDPRWTLMEDRSILGAVFDGLLRSDNGGCDFAFPSEELTNRIVIDMVRDPSDPSRAYAVTSNGGRDNLVYRTEDDGVTWAPTGPPIEPILFEKVRVAPSSPDTLYLSGAYPPTADLPRRPFVHRSRDGGATWESFAFTLNDGERNVFLLAVDPMDPDRLYVRVSHDADYPDTPERLVRSDDGGETWVDLLSLPELRGLALSDDGATVYVGGKRRSVPTIPGFDAGPGGVADPLHGLWTGSPEGPFTHVRDDLSINCLAVRDGEVWACLDQFRDGMSVGRSADGGASFSPVLILGDIAGPVECGEASGLSTTCRMELSDLARDLSLPVDAGLPMDGGADAGTDAGMRPSGGGGCAVTPASAGPEAPLALLALAALLGTRRRRAVG